MDIWSDIIPYIQRPSRYLGGEINAVEKDKARTYIALVFPDLYEIGMSHLGLKILYHVLNQRTDTAAERLFAPDLDYETLLRRHGYPLTSLETSRPLHKFDLIGFSLQYELTYTNILNILNLGQIPLKASERDRDLPIVIAGGPGAFNPEPLAPFIDLFVIGEGEEVILELVDTYQQWRDASGTKEQLLKELNKIPGIYVPSLTGINGTKCTKKRVIQDLDSAPYPVSPIVPYPKIVHDRIVLEIARGCSRGCRFCQAGIIYRPLRERSPEKIKVLTIESLRNTGYDEISLVSLNTGEYSCLTPLVADLMQYLVHQRISLSLPTLRPGSLNSTILEEIGKVRKTGFTLVPEAGTERLRKAINKEMAEEQLLKDIERLLDAGWDALKLYFMIGLPTETQEDIDGIISLCQKVLASGKNNKNRRIRRVSVSLSPFVPKPHTPFQWLPQEELAALKEKLRYIRHRLKDGRFIVRWQLPEISFLEAVIARGDKKLATVIERAYHLGCRFDSWSEKLDFQKWLEAFHYCGLDPKAYANTVKNPEETLYWEHISTGVKKEFLWEEFIRSQKAVSTPDCRIGQCLNCGIGCQPLTTKPLEAPCLNSLPLHHPEPGKRRSERIRLKLEKKGPMRYLSHLEFQQLFYRASRRSQIPIIYSQGAHPHPKISLGQALPVGVESEGEFVDIELTANAKIMTLIDQLNSQLPYGLRVTSWQRISPGYPPIALAQENFKFKIDIEIKRGENIRISHKERINNFMKQEKALVRRQKEGQEKVIDIRPLVGSINLINEDEKTPCLELVLKNHPQGSAKPTEVLEKIYEEDMAKFSSIRIKKLAPDHF